VPAADPRADLLEPDPDFPAVPAGVAVGGATRSPGANGSGIVASTASASAEGPLSTTVGCEPLEMIAPPDTVFPTATPACADVAGAAWGCPTLVAPGG
jgi:hypothetical protein